VVEGDAFTGARQLGLLNFSGRPWLVEDSVCDVPAGLKPSNVRAVDIV